MPIKHTCPWALVGAEAGVVRENIGEGGRVRQTLTQNLHHVHNGAEKITDVRK
jgi:hypothetical protein